VRQIMGDSMPNANGTKNRASVKKGGNVCCGQAPVTQPTFCKLLTSSIHPRKDAGEFAINCPRHTDPCIRLICATGFSRRLLAGSPRCGHLGIGDGSPRINHSRGSITDGIGPPPSFRVRHVYCGLWYLLVLGQCCHRKFCMTCPCQQSSRSA
jgi:hypothetical protein